MDVHGLGFHEVHLFHFEEFQVKHVYVFETNAGLETVLPPCYLTLANHITMIRVGGNNEHACFVPEKKSRGCIIGLIYKEFGFRFIIYSTGFMLGCDEDDILGFPFHGSTSFFHFLVFSDEVLQIRMASRRFNVYLLSSNIVIK